jgi:hypothetical protein
MKSTTLPAVAFLAAIAAFVLLPVSAAAAAIAFTLTGVLCMLVADYGRTIEPVRPAAEIIPFDSGRRTPACLNRAA